MPPAADPVVGEIAPRAAPGQDRNIAMAIAHPSERAEGDDRILALEIGISFCEVHSLFEHGRAISVRSRPIDNMITRETAPLPLLFPRELLHEEVAIARGAIHLSANGLVLFPLVPTAEQVTRPVEPNPVQLLVRRALVGDVGGEVFRRSDIKEGLHPHFHPLVVGEELFEQPHVAAETTETRKEGFTLRDGDFRCKTSHGE